MNGVEMMLNNMLKGLGLDPEELKKIAQTFQDAAETILKQNTQILQNQRRIMRHLDIPLNDEGDEDGRE